MNIYYQGNPGSYMGIASEEIAKNLNIDITEIIWVPDFTAVWEKISEKNIGVLAIENSYMGSIHPNIYNFINYDYQVIWEYYLEIQHCLCSLETNIKNVEVAYSQAPALDQCRNYLKEKWIDEKSFWDTALSAKYIQEHQIKKAAAICSIKAAKLYELNILDTNIADQKGNTTRFIAIVPKNSPIKNIQKSNKISMIFETKNIPSSLYKCLWAFATNNINLSKIESIPSYKDRFSYYFWLECEGNLEDESMKKTLEELEFFTKQIRILGEY